MNEKFSNKNPFKVPEGYFEGLQQQVQQRILEEEIPVRKLEDSTRRMERPLRLRVAIAAAIVAIALISYPLVKIIIPGTGVEESYSDLVLLEETGLLGDVYDLAEYLETDEAEVDTEEAYIEEAMNYLAMNDVEMDIIFESY